MKLIYILLLTSVIYASDYNRSLFFYPSDEDEDCQDTRTEVLIKQNLHDVRKVRLSDNRCDVVTGLWFDNYSGKYIHNPKLIEIDHIIPLKEAWLSGADKWDNEKRKRFANYLKDDKHLIVISIRENRTKGSKPPQEWLPYNIDYHIEYCRIWCKIKVKWNLTATKEEVKFLKDILKDDIFITYPKIRD